MPTSRLAKRFGLALLALAALSAPARAHFLWLTAEKGAKPPIAEAFLSETPDPDGPALICLDKSTGKLLGQERSGICRRMFLSNWSSPAYGVVAGKPMVVFGGGDGICYGFDPEPVPSSEGAGTLREIWRCDCNPTSRRMKDGKPRKHSDSDGPSEIISTPVTMRPTSPASTAPGPSSRKSETPSSFASRSIDSIQRTEPVTCLVRTSRAVTGSRTGSAVKLAMTGNLGASIGVAASDSASRACAGAIKRE